MKKIYKIYVQAPFPVAGKFTKEVEELDCDNTIGFLFLNSREEIEKFIESITDDEIGVFAGFPNDFNCLITDDCWHLIDDCEVIK